jgi:hypothetical protein
MEVFHSSMAQNRRTIDEVKAANKEEREWVHQVRSAANALLVQVQ